MGWQQAPATHVRKPDHYETKLDLAEICRLGFDRERSESRGSRETKKHRQDVPVSSEIFVYVFYRKCQ